MKDREGNIGLTPAEVEALIKARQARLKVERANAQRQRAGRWINAGQFMITLYAIAGVIGGVALAIHTQSTEGLLSDETTHPFIGHGIGLATLVIATWTVTMAALAFMEWRVHDE